MAHETKLKEMGVDVTQQSAPRDRTQGWFWGLMLFHLLLWTIAPVLTQQNATLDTVEMVIWGHEWEWGYYKHPPLPAWISEASVLLFGPTLWPLHVLAQLFVVATFWAVWRLGREWLDPWPALTCVALLQTCFYFNFAAVDLNNNSAAKAGWAFATLMLYWAIKRDQWKYWIGFGAAIGISFLSKYDVVLLVGSMLAFTGFFRETRAIWKRPGPYVAIATAMVFGAPHLAWLIETDFVTLEYLQNRTGAAHTAKTWVDHLVNPLKFLKSQFLAVSGILLVSVLLYGWRWRWKPLDTSDAKFSRTYLAAVVLGPPVLALVYSFATGARLRTPWGAAMFSFLPLLLWITFEGVNTARLHQRVAKISSAWSVAFAVALAVHNILSPYVRDAGSRVHFPGQALAEEVERRWSEVSSVPLEIVAGQWWEAGNVALYGQSRASVFINMTDEYSPWTSDKELSAQGGVIVWQHGDPSAPGLEALRERFPGLDHVESFELPWQTGADLEPIRIGLAIILPQESAGTETTNRSRDSQSNQRIAHSGRRVAP